MFKQLQSEVILICNAGNHNKFWRSYYDQQTQNVIIKWGRIGTTGQFQTKSFASEYEAGRFISNKCEEKRRKGYVDRIDGKLIDQAMLQKMAVEATIIGTQNKCHTFEWVEVEGSVDSPNFKPINESRLYEPSCTPGMLIALTTKKEYDGKTNFTVLLTLEGGYKFWNNHFTKIDDKSDLHELVTKLEAAIGHRMST